MDKEKSRGPNVEPIHSILVFDDSLHLHKVVIIILEHKPY